ncbi:methyltransferase family protein [Sediminihabitans luteus]|uniref:Methyltransferase family protein n=1 Tax=Sediminihabitans luteus TaxID=1138585 RepID=A0A2M9CPG5_9CELL|nr:class I SAM-dependent methyltransferase [Sediminihabitans luteus]PJJ73785.1 methyltransferase family protein [Sediminihabitans luteus]GIJ00621.1 hypothetical protein Slu03_29980 [Sediminihabitans luteus]
MQGTDPTAYDASFAHLCAGTHAHLLDRVREVVRPPGALLDVGTGTGMLARRASEAGFLVTGVDHDPGMLAAATARAPGARFALGTLPALAVADGAFDAAVANFVINHVADPRASVAEMHRCVRPGGVAATAIWGTFPNPLAVVWDAMIELSGAYRPAPATLDPALEFERTPEGLAGLHRAAGASDVDAGELSWTWTVVPADVWRAVAGGVAGIGAVYRANTAGTQEAMRVAFDAITSGLAVDGALHLESRAVWAIATA